MHGKDAIIEEVLDWEPYDHVTLRSQFPIPDVPKLVNSFVLEPSSTTADRRRDARPEAALGEGSGDPRGARCRCSTPPSGRAGDAQGPRRGGAAARARCRRERGAGAASSRGRGRNVREPVAGRPDNVDPDAFVRRLVRRRGRGARPTRRHEMRYLLLIYGPEPSEDTPPEAIATVMGDYNKFTAGGPGSRRLRGRRGAPADGDARPRSASATARRSTTDGPFAETKEALGGFYLVDARTSTRRSSSRRRSRRPGRLDRGPADLGRRGRRGGRGRAGAPADRRRSIRPRPRRPRSDEPRRSARRRRPRLPRGAGPGRRDADPRPRRLRPRRGGGPGRLHHRAGDAGPGAACPPTPGAWITTTARNRAIDRLRRRRGSPRRRSCSAARPRSRTSCERSTRTPASRAPA